VEDDVGNPLSRADLRSRYLINGRLVMKTALHIGGGNDVSTVTDSPVVRLPMGEPYIPGSSLKGAFRAAVERFVPLLPGYRTCQLADDDRNCLSARRNEAWGEAYQVLKRSVGRELRNSEGQSALDVLRDAVEALGGPPEGLRALDWPDWLGKSITDDHLLALLEILLCDTCRTFGSVHLASVAAFHDLPVEGQWYQGFQVRDGVGIDRDSERAKPQIKFDFEVVPPDSAFAFSLVLESPSARDLALVALGLQEFMDGMVSIGGIRSRGLGRCKLEDVKVSSVNLTDPKALVAYLTSRTMRVESGETFVATHLAQVIAKVEG
jgi:CRISPR/Cas system CSM-associated protein Csm3 (group 7 of RAMP superfamily)